MGVSWEREGDKLIVYTVTGRLGIAEMEQIDAELEPITWAGPLSPPAGMADVAVSDEVDREALRGGIPRPHGEPAGLRLERRGDTGEMYMQTTSDSRAGGHYEVTLPYFDYVMNVRAWHHIPVNQPITVTGPSMTLDFVLEETLANILILDDDDGKYEEQKLEGLVSGQGDQFGYSVAVFDDVIAVGAPFSDEQGNDTGIVYLFRYEPGPAVWNLEDVAAWIGASKR